MAHKKVDAIQINQLHDDWMKKYSVASKLITEIQQQSQISASESNVDINMTKNGSIWNMKKANSTDGAGAGSQNTNIGNNHNNSTSYDIAQTSTGPDTIQVNGASGTTVTSQALTTPDSAHNGEKQSDFAQRKKDAAQEVKNARNKYLEMYAQFKDYDPYADSSNRIADLLNGTTNPITSDTSTASTNQAQNNNRTEEQNGNEKNNPTNKDLAYQKPDDTKERQTTDKQILKEQQQQEEMKQMMQQTQQQQAALENDLTNVT